MRIVSPQRQQGATLVVVLVLLLLITILGTMAIRQSLTSLNIATNSQAQSLLMQNSDAYYLKVEGASNAQKVLNASKFGFIGFASQPENIGQEVVFCYTKDTEQNFDTNNVGVISNVLTTTDDSLFSGKKMMTAITKGFCDPTNAANFTSGRKVVMTQVSVKVQNTPTAPLENFPTATDTELVNPPMRVRINTTSLLPAMASGVSASTIIDCLSKYPADRIIDGANSSATIAECLKLQGVPYSAQVAEYQQDNSPQ